MIYCAIIAFFLCFVFIFYISRHTWASLAKWNGVEEAVISEAMGHNNIGTTTIYLASLDTEVIGAANRTVVDCLFAK